MDGSPHTAGAYHREAERSLLWAVIERRLPLSSHTTEDAITYSTDIASIVVASWAHKCHVQ